MDRVRRFVVRGGVGDVRRHDQHGDAAFRQRRLAGRDRFAPGLLGRQDHLAIDAAALVHVIEVDLLDRLDPMSCRTIWVAIRMTGARLRLAS